MCKAASLFNVYRSLFSYHHLRRVRSFSCRSSNEVHTSWLIQLNFGCIICGSSKLFHLSTNHISDHHIHRRCDIRYQVECKGAVCRVRIYLQITRSIFNRTYPAWRWSWEVEVISHCRITTKRALYLISEYCATVINYHKEAGCRVDYYRCRIVI